MESRLIWSFALAVPLRSSDHGKEGLEAGQPRKAGRAGPELGGQKGAWTTSGRAWLTGASTFCLVTTGVQKNREPRWSCPKAERSIHPSALPQPVRRPKGVRRNLIYPQLPTRHPRARPPFFFNFSTVFNLPFVSAFPSGRFLIHVRIGVLVWRVIGEVSPDAVAFALCPKPPRSISLGIARSWL